MSKSKDCLREIAIQRSEGEESQQENKASSSSSSSYSSGIKSILSNPLKSMKKRRSSQSLQIVLEGAHDPKDEHFVQSFRELLFLDGILLGKHNDYHTLLRFLRMRDFDLSKAKDMFVNYLKWRDDYKVDAIPKELKFEEYSKVKKWYPHGYHGVDKYGRPLYIERIGMVDFNIINEVSSIERFVKYHVSEQEKTLNLRFPACAVSAAKHIASTTSILDVKGVGMSNFSKPARCLFMEIQKIDSNYYPETLNQLFIVNAGSGFRMLWKALRAFLDARTLAKIHVLGSNYLNNLHEVIDASNLPSFLGGNCTCSDYGGCLFSDKGPWNNPKIVEIIQAVCAAVELYKNGEVKGQEDIESEGNKFVENKQKIQALEAVLEQTNLKIKSLEIGLEETKTVLKELAQRIEALKT
ncbi:phosphatidylinositol/phosphatidylcholine transfer protein SFH11 [Euphorbia lathyris]|uniref:phosphatidylinositol/phosphatidylcholine transfer protein SFH11 n=1 Tax=Euphorbia lathyris TaxID=212925 RepID=UPI003313A57F